MVSRCIYQTWRVLLPSHAPGKGQNSNHIGAVERLCHQDCTFSLLESLAVSLTTTAGLKRNRWWKDELKYVQKRVESCCSLYNSLMFQLITPLGKIFLNSFPHRGLTSCSIILQVLIHLLHGTKDNLCFLNLWPVGNVMCLPLDNELSSMEAKILLRIIQFHYPPHCLASSRPSINIEYVTKWMNEAIEFGKRLVERLWPSHYPMGHHWYNGGGGVFKFTLWWTQFGDEESSMNAKFVISSKYRSKKN